MSEWQPADTAPLKTLVLVCNPNEGTIPVIAKRYADGWMNVGAIPIGRSPPTMGRLDPPPTHWMPLPPPPIVTAA